MASQDCNISETIESVALFSLRYGDSISTLRVIGPLEQLGINVVRCFENRIVDKDNVRVADIIVLSRDFPRFVAEYEQVMSLAKEFNIPVVLDIDDLLFEMPEDHPDRLSHFYSDALLPLFRAVIESDLITVTTKELKSYLLPHNENIIVLPNFLDDSIWKLSSPKNGDGTKIVIGYMGSLSHKPDLEMITPVLQRLLECYQASIEIHFWVVEPPQSLRQNPQVHWHARIIPEYTDFARYFEAQNVDIFIAPLTENSFNNAKSHIKFLEYSALGVPGVYSNIDPYSKIISHGVTGLLASDLVEWEKNLKKLIEDDDFRFHLARKAQKSVKIKWLLSDNAFRWRRAYQGAFLNTKKERIAYQKPHSGLMGKISIQVTEMKKDFLRQLAERDAQLAERDAQLAERDAQLGALYNSHSWKITKPLRFLIDLVR